MRLITALVGLSVVTLVCSGCSRQGLREVIQPSASECVSAMSRLSVTLVATNGMVFSRTFTDGRIGDQPKFSFQFLGSGLAVGGTKTLPREVNRYGQFRLCEIDYSAWTWKRRSDCYREELTLWQSLALEIAKQIADQIPGGSVMATTDSGKGAVAQIIVPHGVIGICVTCGDKENRALVTLSHAFGTLGLPAGEDEGEKSGRFRTHLRPGVPVD